MGTSSVFNFTDLEIKVDASEFVRMGDDEAVTTVPDIEESKEHNETKKGQSTTTTTTTVLTKTWLLGFPRYFLHFETNKIIFRS